MKKSALNTFIKIAAHIHWACIGHMCWMGTIHYFHINTEVLRYLRKRYGSAEGLRFYHAIEKAREIEQEDYEFLLENFEVSVGWSKDWEGIIAYKWGAIGRFKEDLDELRPWIDKIYGDPDYTPLHLVLAYKWFNKQFKKLDELMPLIAQEYSTAVQIQHDKDEIRFDKECRLRKLTEEQREYKYHHGDVIRLLSCMSTKQWQEKCKRSLDKYR